MENQEQEWMIPFELIDYLNNKLRCYDINVLIHRSHGVVLRCRMEYNHHQYDKEVIIKVTSLETRRRNENFKREVKNHKLMQQNGAQHVCPLLHSKRIKCTSSPSVGIIVLEKMDIDLMDFILSSSLSLPIIDVKTIFKRICEAVAACHQRGIAHLDLKPDNILLNFDSKSSSLSSLKLCDFGCSLLLPLPDHRDASLSPSSASSSSSSSSSLSKREMRHLKAGTFGTIHYLPPECIPISSSQLFPSLFPQPGVNVQPLKIDVYSLGVILFVMISRRFPKVYSQHEDREVHCLVDTTRSSYFECLKLYNEECTEECAALISAMLHDDASLRPTMEEIIHHPFLSN